MIDSDACLKYTEEEHYCPHCNARLSCCHTPPFHVGDGLGWGSEVFFVCLNNDCPLFVSSWQRFEEEYGQSAACRYMLLPGQEKGTPMMVQSQDAFTGSIVDPEEIKAKNKRFQQERDALAKLDSCVAEHNLEPCLTLILDEKAGLDGRKRACELVAEINDLACIDPIRNHRFYNPAIEHEANQAVAAVLKANFKKECPHCMEVIKTQAKVCKHCGRESG